MPTEIRSESRERLLVVAERLFSERGYSAVTLRDIATELGIRQASLYYHMPNGKEQLYVQATERGLDRARVALERAIDEGGLSLRDQLAHAARYLLSQPPFDLARMVRSDMPAISEINARHLTRTALNSLVRPIEQALADARTRGEHHMPTERLLASSFLAIIETIHVSQRFTALSGEAMADMMIDVLLDGLHPRRVEDRLPDNKDRGT